MAYIDYTNVIKGGIRLDSNADLNIVFSSKTANVTNLFGANLQGCFDKAAKTSGGDYWWTTTSGQNALNMWPSTLRLRMPGGTNSWGNTIDVAYKGHGYKKYRDNGAMGPGNIALGGEDFDENFYNNTSDQNEDDNFHDLFLNSLSVLPKISTADNLYVVNYHQDWNGSSYDTTETASITSSNKFSIYELGNEMNAPGARCVFSTAADFTTGGAGWDQVPTGGAKGNYVIQNRAFATTKSQQIKALQPSSRIFVTSPPPEWYHFEANGIPLTSRQNFNKAFANEVAARIADGTLKADGWIHHVYNKVSSNQPRGTLSMPNTILQYLDKYDVSCQSATCYDLFYQGIQSDYYEYIMQAYVRPYEKITEAAGVRQYPKHIFTEWAMGDQYIGVSDTILGGCNIIKYMAAYCRVAAATNNRVLAVTYQKLFGRPINPIDGGIVEPDRMYAHGLIIPAQPGNIYGLTPNDEYQPTLELEAFNLFTTSINGTFIDTEKFIKKTKNSAVSKEQITVAVFRKSANKYDIIYANTSDEDITINFRGSNTYWQGDSVGPASQKANEWVSGTYDGGIAGLPLAQKYTNSNDNTLRRRTFGKLVDVVPTSL